MESAPEKSDFEQTNADQCAAAPGFAALEARRAEQRVVLSAVVDDIAAHRGLRGVAVAEAGLIRRQQVQRAAVVAAPAWVAAAARGAGGRLHCASSAYFCLRHAVAIQGAILHAAEGTRPRGGVGGIVHARAEVGDG